MTVYRSFKLTVLVVIAAFAVTAICGSCNLIKKIPGNVAGQVMNAAGQGRGFVSVQLIEAETGVEWGMENSDDTGNFMFSSVEPGKYIIKVVSIGGAELSTNAKEFNLMPGKTLKLEIIVNDNPQEETEN